MRFVAVKGIEQQAAGMAFRTRDLFIRQKTHTINALRGHLAEYGIIAPAVVAKLGRPVEVMQRADSGLPTEVIELARMLMDPIAGLHLRIDTLDRDIRKRARQADVASRMMTVPGAVRFAHRDDSTGTTGREFCARPGFLGLAGFGAEAEFIRRQGTVGANIEDGPTRSAPPAHHRCDGSGQMGGVAGAPGGLLAREDDDPKATHASRCGARE